MHRKPILLSLFISLFFVICFWYSLAIAAPNLLSFDTKIIYQESENIFLDSGTLNSFQMVIKSSKDLSWAEIIAPTCDIFSEIKTTQGKNYVYDIKFFNDPLCQTKSINILHENENIYSIPVSIVTESSLISTLTDYSDKKLQKTLSALKKQITRYDRSFESEWTTDAESIQQKRKWSELNYTSNIVENIVKKRAQKYLVPVEWYTINESHPSSKIPNALRPYRSSYTDGIHHGWDVGSQLWQEVRSIDDWVVVRVVSEFDWSDFDNIVYRDDATEEQQTNNLDILRWKQVWIKTSRWDIVLYAHLDDIYAHIAEWSVVRKWEPIGTIWITGVPDKNYDDYHLHFSIHKNPHNDAMAGKYTLEDYLSWDWYYKWASKEEVYYGQSELFE